MNSSTDGTEGVVIVYVIVQQLIDDGERHLNSSNERASCQVLLNHLESTNATLVISCHNVDRDPDSHHTLLTSLQHLIAVSHNNKHRS